MDQTLLSYYLIILKIAYNVIQFYGSIHSLDKRSFI